jgi:hypothetical protein
VRLRFAASLVSAMKSLESDFGAHGVPNGIISSDVMRIVVWAVAVCLFGIVLADISDDIVFGEDPRKPIDVDQKLLCHSCHAAVIETVKYVRST